MAANFSHIRVPDNLDGTCNLFRLLLSFPGYPEKLAAMGEAVHANDGLWIAPAAPGFDARLIGGTTVVDRKDGETLQIQ